MRRRIIIMGCAAIMIAGIVASAVAEPGTRSMRSNSTAAASFSILHRDAS